MKNYLLLIFLFSFGSAYTQESVSNPYANKAPKGYTSKTYTYLGNTFIEKYDGKIDSSNYTFKKVYKDGKLQSQFYPKFGGNSRRLINYNYYPNGDLKSKISETDYGTGTNRIDSVSYKIIDSVTTVIYTYPFGEKPQKEIHRKSKDTLFIDFTLDEKTLYTSKEFWESKNIKQSYQIFPEDTQEANKLINKYTYDNNGELTQMDRYKNEEKIETSLRIDLSYDAFNRVVKKVNWAGEEKMLSYIEFTIFE